MRARVGKTYEPPWKPPSDRSNIPSVMLKCQYAAKPALMVLPDRVIVVGAPEEELTVTLKARPLGLVN